MKTQHQYRPRCVQGLRTASAR